MTPPVLAPATPHHPHPPGNHRQASPAPRPVIDALIIGRLVRPPLPGADHVALVIAVNLPTRAATAHYRRSEHATILQVRAEGPAQQRVRGQAGQGLCGALVRIEHCALELVPFTLTYESVDHRLEGRFVDPGQFTVLVTASGAPALVQP